MDEMTSLEPTYLTPQRPPNPFLVMVSVVVGVFTVVALIVGIIISWPSFLQVGQAIFYIVACVVILGIIAAVVVGIQAFARHQRHKERERNLEFTRAENALEAERQMNQARAEMMVSEAIHRRRTALIADGLGNAFNADDYGRLASQIGNAQVPHSIHYSYKNDTQIEGGQQGMLPAPAQPTIQELIATIARNSLQIPLGRSLQTQQPIVVELLDAHIKVIGGSRMGKSCEAGAILDIARQTHDNHHLLLALLDLENKTSRLFENDPHILTVNTGYKHVKMHARDVAQVAECIIVLHDLMNARYSMSDAEQERQPHVLIYLEEFLYWKKLLGQFVDKQTRQKALDSFAGIATRGIKVGLHLMACAQVDYADEELRDAMAQFLAVNVAFSVKPSAAQAAGFVNAELLKKNYEARTPGQFVVEAIGGSDLGVAPDYDVRAKVRALNGVVEADPLLQERYQTRVSEVPENQTSELQPNYSRTTGRIETDPALQAKVVQVMANPGENMNECIKRVWNAYPGDNNKYKQAKQEYIQVQEIIHSLARRGMQSYQSSEMED